MKIAVVGPMCHDINTVDGVRHKGVGGPAFYIGEALSALGVETDVFASYSGNMPEFGFDLCKMEAEGTILFENTYVGDARTQKATIYPNVIDAIPNPESYDYVVLGPLYNDNIGPNLLQSLKDTKTVLLPQGLIRYLDGDKIVWKNPDNVRDVVKSVDYMFLDEKELEFIGGDLEGKAIWDLKEMGAGGIVVTRAEKGSTLFLDRRYEIPAYKVKEFKDPTGAGDSYAAGFLAHEGIPAAKGRFAAMTATMSIENGGPFRGSHRDVLDRLHQERNGGP